MAAMAAVRVKREIIAPERYPEGVFLSKLCRKKTRVKTTDRKLYPVVVTDVDKVGKRVKIHYVGYSERYDEWRACESEDNNLFQRMELLSSPSSSSLDDRMELIHSIAQLVSRIPSEPEFFLVNFSAIVKIATHLRGSCLYLILIRKSKETHFITNTYRKVAQ